MLFDTSIIPQNSLDDLTAIFQKITFKSQTTKSTTATTNPNEGQHLLILQKSISSIINRLTPFSTLKKQTRIGKVIWLDPSPKGQQTHDYDQLFSLFKSLVIMVESDNDIAYLTQTMELLKTRIIPFASSPVNSAIGQKVRISIVFAGDSQVRSNKLMLENLGVLGDVDIYHWLTYKPVLLDRDLISLDMAKGGLDHIFHDSSVIPIDSLAKCLLQLVIASNYKIRVTNAYLKGSGSIKFFKHFQKLYDTHLNSLPPHVKKVVVDQDETLFVDAYSFFNRNVDLVCIDRGVDLVAAVGSQLTYTGLCDTLIGTELGAIAFKPDSNDISGTEAGVNTSAANVADTSGSEDFVRFRLGDSKDEIFSLIKDLNFSHVGSILNNKARQIQAEYDKRNQLKDIEEMKKFVGELNRLKELQTWVKRHTLLAEHILGKVKAGDVDEAQTKVGIPELDNVELGEPSSSYFSEFIELQQDILADQLDNKANSAAVLEFMYKHEPKIHDIIKLLIITSIVKKGIREPEYDIFKTEILNMYGMKYIPLLIKLNELKLVYPREQVSFLSTATNYPESSNLGKVQLINDFNLASKSLNLLPETTEEQPFENTIYSDADFSYPGYVPIITRLVESIYSRSYNGRSAAVGSTVLSTPPRQPHTQSLIQSPSSSSYTSLSQAVHQGKQPRKYGWDNLDLSSINGEIKQEFLVPENKRNLFNSFTSLNAHVSNKMVTTKHNRKDMIIVCCIGGLTYSEISSLRYVIQQAGNDFVKDKQLLILTTGVIKSDDVIEALF
ncbi:unnamed protein product [Ambrosiozyma monospora]|uniref:Unnamed protein product n=1 Tax=Ambrosiozyma monospora TaxID=43982 RepID=A0A9W6YQY2_AMBMO|nr:unnamed protein product [Ambrosiozyma monospora]